MVNIYYYLFSVNIMYFNIFFICFRDSTKFIFAIAKNKTCKKEIKKN